VLAQAAAQLAAVTGQGLKPGADIEALGLERGHRTLVVTRKGSTVVTMLLAPHGRSTWPLASAARDRSSWLRTAGGWTAMVPPGSSAR
jgi:phosphopantothenate synthetase